MDQTKMQAILRNWKIRQCQLAKASGLSVSKISTLIRGWEKPGPLVGEKIRRALESLGVPKSEVDFLFRSN